MYQGQIQNKEFASLLIQNIQQIANLHILKNGNY